MVKKQGTDQKDERNDHPDQKHKEGRVMLNEAELMAKFQREAKAFYDAYYARQYAKAYYTYFRVHTTALMCELEPEQMIKLFGNRLYIPEDAQPLEGCFPMDMVQKTSDICTIHHMTMDELHLHPREPGILHDEQDCITKVCTRRHPEGIPIYDVLQAKK